MNANGLVTGLVTVSTEGAEAETPKQSTGRKRKNSLANLMWRKASKTWYFKKSVNGKNEFNGRKTPFSLETDDVNVAKAKRDAILRAGDGAEIDRVLGRSSKPLAKLTDIEAAYLAADKPERTTRVKNLAALRRVIERGGLVWTSATVADLTGGTVQNFQDWMVKRAREAGVEDDTDDMARIKFSADRTLIQARSVFAHERPFRHLHMPMPSAFLEADLFKPNRDTRYAPMSEAELALFAAECFDLKARVLGLDDGPERDQARGIWGMFLAMRYLGLRNVEAESMRPREWIVPRKLRDGDGTVRDGWVLQIKPRPAVKNAAGEILVPAFNVKAKGSTRDLPVAAWLRAELLATADTNGFLLPGSTFTDRHDISAYAFSEWMADCYERGIAAGVLPADVEIRTPYDWRKQAGSETYHKSRDILATSKWLGHTSVHTSTKWYVSLIQALPSIA